MTKLVDIVGEKFSRLTVMRRNGWNNHGQTTWDCKCDCGKWVPNLSKAQLVTGNTRSCGCIRIELLQSRNASHGKTDSRIYRIYSSMRTRCLNENNKGHKDYGGRGIKCLWKTFEDFYADMGEGYETHAKKHGERNTTIDRINNNDHYYKENCRWATYKKQANNTTRNHYIEYKGETKTLAQWAEITGIRHETIRHRLKRGYTTEEALTLKKYQLRNYGNKS